MKDMEDFEDTIGPEIFNILHGIFFSREGAFWRTFVHLSGGLVRGKRRRFQPPVSNLNIHHRDLLLLIPRRQQTGYLAEDKRSEGVTAEGVTGEC